VPAVRLLHQARFAHCDNFQNVLHHLI
jgi:hypothetical protein